MRHQRVLNRPMFNRNNSAYGRGIASNLVSEEERQRFNAGGRVGMFWGGIGAGATRAAPWLAKQWGRIKPTSIPKYKTTGELYKQPFVQKEIPFKERAVSWMKENPWWTGAGAIGATSDPAIGTATGLAKGAKATAKWGAEALTPGWAEKYLPWDVEGVDKDDKTSTAIPKDKATGMVDEALKVEKRPPDEADEASDILDWTPKEKEEKKSQIMLSMAERLISGSRDKWGSKAQMENIGGALGDIRKITDKSEDRAMQKKYKAYWEGKSKADQDYLKAQAKSGMNYDVLRREVGKVRAAELVGDTTIKTFDSTKKKGNPKLKIGDIYYDVEKDQFKLIESEDSERIVGPNDIKILKETGVLDKLKGGIEITETDEVIKAT